MGIPSPTTYESGLNTVSPIATVLLALNATFPPPPPAPPSTAQPPSGAIQASTIGGIVIGLVGFVVLVLAASFLSRLPCFRKAGGAHPTSFRPRAQLTPRTHNYTARDRYFLTYYMNRPIGSRPARLQHVELPIAGRRDIVPTAHLDDLPPYQYPPPYSEATQCPPQPLPAPPGAAGIA